MAKDVQDGTAVYGMSTYRIPMLVNGKDIGMERYQQEDYLADLDSIDKAFKESLNASKRPIAGGGADHSREDAMYLKQKKADDGEKIVDNLVETADAGMTIGDALSMGALAGLGGKLLLEGGKAIGKKVGKKIPSMGSKRGFFNAEWQKAHPEYDAKALQYALAKKAYGDDLEATRLMNAGDLGRDELTTALQREMDDGVPITRKLTNGRGRHKSDFESVGRVNGIPTYKQRSVELDIGDGSAIGGETALHETGHLNSHFQGKEKGAITQGVGKYKGLQFKYPSENSYNEDIAKQTYAMLDNSNVGSLPNKYVNTKKKDLNVYDIFNDIRKTINNDARFKNMDDGLKNRIAQHFADGFALRPKELGGVYQTPSGFMNGYSSIVGTHKPTYVSEHQAWGEPYIGAEELLNNLFGFMNGSSEARKVLTSWGFRPEEIEKVMFSTRLPKDAGYELKLAEQYAKDPAYNEFKERKPFKMRPTGSHADDFFEKELDFRMNNSEASPEWKQAVKEGWMGNTFEGKFDDKMMQKQFERWAKDNGVTEEGMKYVRGQPKRNLFDDEFEALEPSKRQQIAEMDNDELVELIRRRRETGKPLSELLMSDEELNSFFGK